MSLKSLKFASAGALLAGSIAAVGCAERTDLGDVQAARDAVREEQHETAEVRQESAEEIAEAERKEAAVRHEAMRPVTGENSEDVRDAAHETAETRQEAAAAVQEEQQDTAEAKEKLRDTEARFQATQARDKYVADHQTKLDAAEKRIEVLNDRAANEEGATKEATEKQAAELQTAHDRAEEALDNVGSAELLKWTDQQSNVKQAFDALQIEMDQSA